MVVTTEQLELDWASTEAAAQGITGTPYGPVLAGLGSDEQAQIMADLRDRMTAGDGSAVEHQMTAVLGRGVAS